MGNATESLLKHLSSRLPLGSIRHIYLTLYITSVSIFRHKAGMNAFVQVSFFFFLSFVFFRAASGKYGGSQARGLIEATAAGLHHSHTTPDLSRVCDLHHSSWQRQVLNPLSEARDQTHNLVVPSRIRFHCATTGTPPF